MFLDPGLDHIFSHMEALALHTGAPTLHWEDSTSFISVVEAKRVTNRVKNIDIPVCFLQEQFDNGLFIPNMRSLVSFWQICAPNHVQVQFSVVVLNV